MYNIVFFEGRLGREHLLCVQNSEIVPHKGDIVGLREECWEVIHTVIDYETEAIENGKNYKISVFLKRYVWPDEEL